MSLDFTSKKQVTMDQLIAAGKQCGIAISEIPNDDRYMMTWDVDDFENYATNVLTNPDTQEGFRNCIEPENGRFIMRRPFYMDDRGYFHYSVFNLSGGCSDDLGIAHRLMKELGIELNCLDGLYDEKHKEMYECNEQCKREEMSQEAVALCIKAENTKGEKHNMRNNTSTPDGRCDQCIKIFNSIENELKDKLDVEDDWYLLHDISPDILFGYIEEVISHDDVDDIAYDLLAREYINRQIAFDIDFILKEIGKETGIENELTKVFALLESLQKQGEILGSIYDEIYSRPIMFEVTSDSLLYGGGDE